jgi:HK97 family phage major capsid protein
MSDITDTQEIQVDESVVNAVALKAVDTIKATLTIPTAEEIAKEMVALTEKTSKKEIHEEETKTEDRRSLKTGVGSLPKEVRFAKAVMAFKNGDRAYVTEYNNFVDKAWMDVNKANYQNVTTTADGGALVPDPEFVAEVERLTDEYGVAARLCEVRRTDRDSVTLLAGTNEVSFTATNEATAVNSQKLTYSATTVALKKYIATLTFTSEIVEDSAIDIFADATNEIARARAKLFDQLVFTDATYGLLTPALADAYKTQTVGTAITDFDADDAMNARYKVASSARNNGRYFMHPTVWNALRQTKEATTGGYLFGAVGGSVTPMIDGIPVELVDVMPERGAISANKAFAVFGDLSRIKIHVKRLLETKVFDSGVVKDAGGSDINLITQDAWAMRTTMRVVPQTRFDGAFTIIGTGTVS